MKCVPLFTREELRDLFAYLDGFERHGGPAVAVHYLQGDYGMDRETADYIVERWSHQMTPRA